MKIYKPEFRQQGKEVVISVPVESSDGTNKLWFKLEKKYTDFVTDTSDAYLVALLIPAMIKGEDIHVAGTISEKLFYNLTGPYQYLLVRMFPPLHRINITIKDIRSQIKRAANVAAGFTGGIDSFSILANHYYADNIPPGLRVSHLFFHNAGYEYWIKTHAGSEAWQMYTRKAAERVGLPFIVVDTNTDTFYPTIYNYKKTYSHRNTIIPLLLQSGIGRSLIASSGIYMDVFSGLPGSLTYSDPLTYPMLSTEAHDIIPTGWEYTRVDKTLQVTEIPASYDTLNICFKAYKGGNCSVCHKCVRTLLTLEIAGLIDRYTASFDLAAYHKVRNKVITGRLFRRDIYIHEILSFARQRHFPIPLYIKLLAYPGNKLLWLRRMRRRTPQKQFTYHEPIGTNGNQET